VFAVACKSAPTAAPAPGAQQNRDPRIAAMFDEAPGGVAVSKEGRVFVSFHPLGGVDVDRRAFAAGVRPTGGPSIKVAEILGGRAVPFPSEAFQHPTGDGSPYFDSVFSVRIDAQGRLWTIDIGFFGLRAPRLMAFDLTTKAALEDFELPPDIAGRGSNIQDFVIDPTCTHVYIADESTFARTPALIVLDLAHSHGKIGSFRRRLQGKPATLAQANFPGRDVTVLGEKMNPALDSIALDRKNEWLYFGAVATSHLYRVRVRDLDDASLDDDVLSARVEDYATKPETGGITTDDEGGVLVNNLKEGRVDRIDPNSRALHTIFTHPKMRWPDGIGFGPSGNVYVADSDLPEIAFQPAAEVAKHRPYYLFVFASARVAPPGE
jgi:sugar lactone lactonase YvrE